MALGLFSLFKSKGNTTGPKGSVLGVDIGTSAIKVVQIKGAKGIPTLETYGELQLGPYEGVEVGRNTHLPQSKLTEALVDILREAGATAKGVAFTIPYNASFINVVDLPTIDPAQVGSMVPIEARKYIPVSLTQVSLDSVVLNVNEDEKKTKVLILATYGEALTKYTAVMVGGGLEMIANEIEVFSSIRSGTSPKDERVAVLDFGAGSTRLYILEKGIVRKTHSVLLSGVELTRALETNLKISFEEAEEHKRTHGILSMGDDTSAQKALLPVLERGLRELHTVMTRYEETEKIVVQKIMLCGSGALLKGLSQYVGNMFSKQIEIADPFAKVAYPAFLQDTLKEAGPSFTVAVGAALRAFQNLK